MLSLFVLQVATDIIFVMQIWTAGAWTQVNSVNLDFTLKSNYRYKNKYEKLKKRHTKKPNKNDKAQDILKYELNYNCIY